MHPRNIHNQGYNFAELVKSHSDLERFVVISPSGNESIDFANPNAVKALNAALLKHYYGVDFWNIPANYLCPPVPGRADYIHALADLLDVISHTDSKIVGLDIGTGANLIYPIIGSQSYGWRFVASDIDKTAIQSANIIQAANPALRKKIRIRHQQNTDNIFNGIIEPSDNFAFSMCNPPFHVSQKAAIAGSVKKQTNLSRNKLKRKPNLKHNAKPSIKAPLLNFAGQKNELWCAGGELGFIQRMIAESINYPQQVGWFTSLVSKKETLKPLYNKLKAVNATEVKTIDMSQGNKASRIIAWRF